MITKMFEIRDRATMIPVIATMLTSSHEQEAFLLRRAGFDPIIGSHVLISRATGGQAEYAGYKWDNGSRTMKIAHE